MKRIRTVLSVVLLTACTPSPKTTSYVDTMRADVPGVLSQVSSQWVRDVLGKAAELPPRAPRVVGDKQLDDTSYYAKYSSPLAYARPLDIAAAFGLEGLSGKKVVDFGYGDIGQLQLFAKAGAHAVGVDPLPLLASLYNAPEDTRFPPGSVELAHGRWPADEAIARQVGKDIDVFIAKNTLKKGYVRPEPPPGQAVDAKKLIDLGVPPERFLPALREATRPGALVVIYNLCPAPSQGAEFLPWSDGRSPFTREEWETAGFEVLRFDADDSIAARTMGHALHWDQGPEAMDLTHGLFAWVTVARRVADSESHHAGHHGNPEDVDRYIQMMEEPSRAEWQKPDDVVRALKIARGQTVCDVGAGPGYFSLRFAKAVGAEGRVYAVDVEPKMLEALRERLSAAGVSNVTPVQGDAFESGLADNTCDLVVIVDTFHHFPDGVQYLKHLTKVLKPGGRVVNIDFHKRKQPVGPPVDHLIARDDFLLQGRAAGLELAQEPAFLPYQYFLILRPVTAR